ncbi:MAG: hypothetical protein R2844_12995 [Caldilineales bacterium]
MSEFANVRSTGIIAMNLDPGDELSWKRTTSGDQELIVVTAGGLALRFDETRCVPWAAPRPASGRLPAPR